MAFRALSLGAGVQSTTVALMAAREMIPLVDVAIFADTQWEPRAVYDHLCWLESVLPFPVHRVTAGSVRDNVFTRQNTTGGTYAAVPYFTPAGIGRRQCTNEYKLKPIQHELRRLLRRSGRKPMPAGSVDLLLGISLDEAHRAKDSEVGYIRNCYPLLDLRMTRGDCYGWLARNGYPTPPKSACIGCPFTSDRRWMERKVQTPEEWADAVAADRALRATNEFMHDSRVPLEEADFSRLDPGRQPDLFGNECSGLCGT